MDKEKIAALEKILDVVFKDKNKLVEAFVHRSYINEDKSPTLTHHNERLEFLGDAVLELVTTEFLYAKYPNKPEGELTAFRSALVNTDAISAVSSELHFGDFLLMSKGEAKDTGKARHYILANNFEAVVGAIHLDQGYEAARRFIEKNLLIKAENIIKSGAWKDAKSLMQEKAQEVLKVTPRYEVLHEAGPDHDKIFTVGLFLGQELVSEGTGKSKQEAEQTAAKKELDRRGW
ncbi:MAG: ribonuclease III [Candidatus Paceibacterota bacterium]|jgi:ribonuclease-3